ncbi:DUF1588 domain-containing protein [Verrucomicrobiales bacterium BCK34]|nr:DUF1588 domain-containing protein [Verrucomicrobiales bacterium BCK34]
MSRLTSLFVAAASLAALCSHSQGDDSYTPGEPVHGDFENFAQGFLDRHCLECHDDISTEGDLNLLDLGPVDETNAAIWKSLWAQVALQEMPPKKETQPEVIERLQFSDWIVSELQRVMADKGGFKEHLDPNKANFIDHNLLFGPLPEGIKLVPTSSPARIWRVTPQEHITRLNELINIEPAFDPAKKGARTRGDVVPTNHGGELKLYFGTDRIIQWAGGTVAYATAVKSIPVVLASNRKHGFENYPDFYTVNSAESTQILDMAENILRYMAYGPLSIVGMPEQITDDPKTYDAVKPPGDLRGLPTAIVYNTKIARELTPVYDLMKEDAAFSDGQIRAAVDYLFEALTFRPPTSTESDDYLNLVKDSIDKVGREDGVFMGLSAIFLDRDALFRPELAKGGKPDDHGRVMLQDWELGLAVNHALSYIKPDATLREAITGGRMKTRDDVEREVTRMLSDETIRKPRILRFFRDYFDHDLGGYICKDTGALAKTGAPGGTAHYRAMFDATASTDRLVELILEEDKNVLKELLTTRRIVTTDNDKIYYGRRYTKEEAAVALAAKKKEDAELAAQSKIRLAEVKEELAALETERKGKDLDANRKKSIDAKTRRLEGEKKQIERDLKRGQSKINTSVDVAELEGPRTYARVSRRSFGRGSMEPERTLATAPEGERLGILTQPSWLVSHSDAMDNHAIHRGIWIRTRLLGGGIPDVPITVDAQLPDEPNTTLRHRMRVTKEEYCWTCHEKMDPLGLPFEMYNHAGLFRTTEFDEPVDATGEIIDSGDPALNGPVTDALDMIRKLAESERVEQVFIRHAFRFWMGRNENLNDAPVLQAAHKAYRDSGGSMNALITSLLTSDAFLYRKIEE